MQGTRTDYCKVRIEVFVASSNVAPDRMRRTRTIQQRALFDTPVRASAKIILKSKFTHVTA